MQDILDLDRYPLHKPGSKQWMELVSRCHTDLSNTGMYSLDGFMRPSVAVKAASAIDSMFASDGFIHEREHNIYFRDDVQGLSRNHPALTRFRTSNCTLCGDQVHDSPMDRLYRWPELPTFLAATLHKKALHPMNDALAGLNVMSYQAGQNLNWHFDRSEFTTTLLLQAPESGGDFLYHTDLRSDDNPNYEGVAKLISGEDPEVRRLVLKPGTLNVFKGKNTPHKVSKVVGKRSRVVAVFSFYESTGVRFSDEERLGFYGRIN